MKRLFPDPRSVRQGFTLVEMLVVMAIIAIVAAISIPAIRSISASYNLSSAGQTVMGQLALARQSALSSNKAVQVRFYNIVDPNYQSSTPVYRAVQIFREDTDNNDNTIYTPMTRAYFFPTTYALSSGTSASSLLVTGTSGASSNTTGDSTNPLPPPYGSSPYVYFRFRSTGLTDLNSGTPSITIYQRSAKVVANALPANFITIEIDSVNGNARMYQP